MYVHTLVQALLESHTPLWQNPLCSYLLGAANISNALSFFSPLLLSSFSCFVTLSPSFLSLSFFPFIFTLGCHKVHSELKLPVEANLSLPSLRFRHTHPHLASLYSPTVESKPGDSFFVLWLSLTSLLTRAERPPAAHIFSPKSFWDLFTHRQH